VFWDITPCSPLKVKRRFGGSFRLHLHNSTFSLIFCSAYSPTLNWRRYIPSKHRSTFGEIYSCNNLVSPPPPHTLSIVCAGLKHGILNRTVIYKNSLKLNSRRKNNFLFCRASELLGSVPFCLLQNDVSVEGGAVCSVLVVTKQICHCYFSVHILKTRQSKSSPDAARFSNTAMCNIQYCSKSERD
jgi:hypothetical protein